MPGRKRDEARLLLLLLVLLLVLLLLRLALLQQESGGCRVQHAVLVLLVAAAPAALHFCVRCVPSDPTEPVRCRWSGAIGIRMVWGGQGDSAFSR